MKKLTAIRFLLCLFALLCVPANALAQKTYVLGVPPIKNPSELKKMFSPLITFLEGELDAKIEFHSSADYRTTMDDLSSGKIDISYLGPAPFAVLDMEHPGKTRICAAILNNGNPTFKGVIVAKKDGPINTLEDIKNKKFALGDRESTLSCYMPAYMLMKSGIFDSVTFEFYGKHDNVAVAVLRDKTAAGGLKPSIAKKYLDKGLKIVAESEPVYEHVIVVGPGVDDATYKKIQSALINLKDATVYQSIKKSITGFTEVQTSDYDNLKKIITAVDAKMGK
ncbi:MAG: phosphate/phosphite/phosphonate ABC transporter substrate-binding protein [Proteobacteria bacterium]|nr:phosphate/phosphite/phosphonate ABC transporter substrate-binding protein [Pseudomonadota bacterium]MBU1058747.1 phosphate/phosphite/phosphonate ABC transporter substrate-binding protein [Pseudomonadota bacterium]